MTRRLDRAPSAPRVPTARHVRWARPIGWFLGHVLWRTTVVGAHNVPATGPVILAANHTGFIDGPLVFGVAPRGVHMFVKESQFRGVFALVLRASGQIPVDGDGGRAALNAGLAILRRGDVVGLFPEGRRGRGDLSHTRAGAAWLALAANAPVVPVAVLGTRRTGERVGVIPGVRRRLVVEFGSPLTLTRAPGVSGKVALAEANVRIQAGLRDVLARAVAGSGIDLPQDDPLAEENL